MLLACLTISLAAEQGKFKYLILSLVLVGIGFNIKMIEAYMLAPAVFITYFLSSAISYKKKIKHLIFGGLVLLAVSLSWALTVDLIPASNRPFIGSSTDNSVMELIIGHNGLERIGLGEKYTNRGNNPPQELTDKDNTLKNQDNNLQNQNRTSQNQMPAGRNGMGFYHLL